MDNDADDVVHLYDRGQGFKSLIEGTSHVAGNEIDQSEAEKSQAAVGDDGDSIDLLYRVDQSPPWHLCLLLGFQQYLTSFASTLSTPLILSDHMCVGSDKAGLAQIIATFYFASGIATLLQTTIGIRLPIIQGPTVAILAPTVAILNLPEWKCPQNTTGGTDEFNVSLASDIVANDREQWQLRMRELQGAICLASLFQVVFGATGLMSLVVRYVGPLTIAPTITLIGISLFRVVAVKASSHWWIALFTCALIGLFSQYMGHFALSLSFSKDKEDNKIKLPIFKLFPILISVLVSWLLCFILTVTGALPDDPNKWGYRARTDIETDAIRDSPWIRVPYPGQWGTPTFNAGSMVGMVCGVMASVIESVGDYYACAKFSGAPPPPATAINRGIAVEGIGGIAASVLGTGNGTTSYGETIASMSITKVGSLRVAQCAGLVLVIAGCVGKLGAVFVSIPEPVIGGLFLAMYGMLLAVGLANLQYVKLASSRNLFVIGMSFFLGLTIPEWIKANPGIVATGIHSLDQIIHVLLSSTMFFGGAMGFFLDNTLPGTLEERGFTALRSSSSDTRSKQCRSTYELPFLPRGLRNKKWIRYLPIYTYFDDDISVEKSDKEDNAFL